MDDKKYNVENLQSLATFLAYGQLPSVAFDMSAYSAFCRRGKDTPLTETLEELQTNCGSVGCAIGWATYLWPKQCGEAFADYADRLLIAGDDLVDEWDWMFGADWSYVDNSREGAAKRIQYFLDNGGQLAEVWSYNKQSVRQYQDVEVRRTEDATAVLEEWPTEIDDVFLVAAQDSTNTSEAGA